MRLEIRRLQKQTGVTAIYVTHDQEEAIVVSDQVLFMSKGKIVESGSPEEIYTRPKKRLTAEFFGDANFLTGVIKCKKHDSLIVETPWGSVACNGRQTSMIGEDVLLFFRPEDVKVQREKVPGSFSLRGVISETMFLGKIVECLVEVENGTNIKVSVHRKLNPRKGEQVYLAIDPDGCSILSE